MKKLILVLITCLTALFTFSQDITGQWYGLLKVQGIQLRIVFNITQTETGYSSTMDSPDQGAKGIPVTSTSFENSVLKIAVKNAKIAYHGSLNKDNIIVGNFKQAGKSFPMDLSKEKLEKATLIRPQEPKQPYPYYTEEVTFENTKDNIVLAGTLTLPQKDGNFPVVVLITGSGPQNRDEELLGHKPFLVLADHLTKNGIGVLRYDDRGTAESTGNFKTATSVELACDAEFAVKYLKTRKEINKDQIGLVGHSEGGVIAPMIAAKSPDINFIVLLAGTGIRGDKLLLLQQQLIGKAAGASASDLKTASAVNKGAFDIILKSNDSESLIIELTEYIKQSLKNGSEEERPEGMNEEEFIDLQVSQLASPWMQYFVKYDPYPTLEKVGCAVLALNGDKDLQVPAKINLEAIAQALKKGGNKNYTTKILLNLNHLFQECDTGSPNEYAKIEQTFSPLALTEISNWITNQVK